MIAKEKGRHFMAKKKTLLIIPIVMIMTILISALTPICAYADNDNYEPRLTAPSSSSPYYSRKLNVYFQTGTPMPNCVHMHTAEFMSLTARHPKSLTAVPVTGTV